MERARTGSGGGAHSALSPEERRQLAIEKLARLFGTSARQTPAEAERRVLLEVQDARLRWDTHQGVFAIWKERAPFVVPPEQVLKAAEAGDVAAVSRVVRGRRAAGQI